jgi:hypothetical protein
MSKIRGPASQQILRCGTLVLIGIVFFSGIVHAEGLRKKFAVEAIYNWNDYILRIRPIDYLDPPALKRVDLLLGRRLGDFSAYLYWKSNSEDEHFLGTRLDYIARGLDDRLRAIFQVRGFLGLNDRSPEHFYFITQWDYQVDRAGNWRPGLLGYGVKKVHGDAVFFLGPAVTTRVTDFLSFRLSYGFDLLDSSTLLYLKCYMHL